MTLDEQVLARAMLRATQPVYRLVSEFVGAAVTACLPPGSDSMAKLAML